MTQIIGIGARTSQHQMAVRFRARGAQTGERFNEEVAALLLVQAAKEKSKSKPTKRSKK